MSSLLRRFIPVACLLFAAHSAHAQVVISQVYGGGGNSGATLKSDFIELHNNSQQAVSLDGWSVQYASATGSSWQTTALNGSIAPGGYYLVKQADGSGGSVALPTPDATGTIAMSGTAGKVALVNSTAALSGACPTGNVDFVGFGSTASCAEGTARAPAPSNTTAILRADNGCTDSDNNSNDFITGTPAPRNSSSIAHVCGGGNQSVLSIADASIAEGNEGITSLTFKVSLSQPASTGVYFDIATQSNTSATADVDYISQTLTQQLIPVGESEYTFTVAIVGDTLDEADETFLVVVSNVTGALSGKAQAIGTILNDDATIIPISSIQGNGDRSPLTGQIVSTSGIVTARRNNGFFIQTPDNDTDNDPFTSDGLYIFTSSTPAANVVVGSKVQVRGTVIEYVPTADPMQPPLTELGGNPTVVVVSNGHALPEPFELTLQFPDPTGEYNQLERLEGMRVTAQNLFVNTPTQGNVNESNATGSSNGVFHAVVAGQIRGVREPGVQMPDVLPAGSPADVPRWNTNPHVIGVSSGALGGERVDAAAGCLVVNSTATGPLDYGFRRYTIYPETTVQLQCDGADNPIPAQNPADSDTVTVASYNLQRFFDDQNDPAIGEPVLTPTAYQARLNKLSLAIRNYLHSPDIIAVQEVENLKVLQDIAAKVSSDSLATTGMDPAYVAYLQEGNDVGGIDVGFLVKTAQIAPNTARVEVVGVTQEGKTTTWTEPAGQVSLLNDRPPLVLQAIVHFDEGRSFPLTTIAVHQRSLNGAEEDSEGGVRVRAKRQKQAEFLADLLQSRQTADASERVLVLGDFNAFEFNDGYVDAMGVVTGLPSPDSTTVIAGDGQDRVNPDYTDLTFLHPADQSYSYAFDGNVQSLDHVLANNALMHANDLGLLELSHARINADFPESMRSAADTPARLSDHDPALVLLTRRAVAQADLSMAASVTPDQVTAGNTATFNVNASNQGPAPAAFAAIAMVFDAVVTPTITAPAGWSCPAPKVTTTTTVTCTTDTLASGSAAQFSAVVTTDNSMAGRSLTMAASVKSTTEDPDKTNDNATAVLQINAAPSADLAVAITGPTTLSSREFTASYVVTVRNIGTLPAAAPTLRIEGNTLNATASIKPAAGWQCEKTRQSGSTRNVVFNCTTRQAVPAQASAQFELKTSTRPTRPSGVITLSAQTATTSQEIELANNRADFSTTITN